MGKLINLRHLDISQTRSLKVIPQSLHSLKALRTITKVVVGRASRISELIKNNQRCLEISGLENIVETKDVLEAEFKEKSVVTELILCWGRGSRDATKDRLVLDAMKPHPNLKKLSIRGYGGIEFSDWIANHSFSNVTMVSLQDCEHCFQLPPFGQLPSLKKLKVFRLSSVEMIGSEFYGSSGATPFPCLKTLQISHMDKLQRLSFEAEEAFPCLEELQLWRCPKLEFTGLPFPSSLKELSIINCNMVYAQRMKWGLKALTKLTIERCNIADSFPEEGVLPTTLTHLVIKRFPNLKSLNGKDFQHLTSLKMLKIRKCPKLQNLPEEGLPSSLQFIKVSKCRILKPRLKRETGQDWHKISHIPYILIKKKCKNVQV